MPATIHNTRDEGLANLLTSSQNNWLHTLEELSWHHYTGTNFAMIARAACTHTWTREGVALV